MDDDGNESDDYSYTYSYEGSDDDTNSHSSDTPMDTKESATAVRHDRLSNSSRSGPIDYGMGDSGELTFDVTLPSIDDVGLDIL